jgi:hypothetical protein
VLASDATWLLPKTYHIIPLYTEVLSSIFDGWVTFVVLVLLFVIGCRKAGGLWTPEQAPNGTFGAGQQQPVQQYWQSPQPVVPQGNGVQYYQQAPPVQEVK